MNFDDGSAMTLNHGHTPADPPWMNQSGPTPPPPRPAVSVAGKYMDRFGTVFNVSGALTLTAWAQAITSPDPAIYPVSNVWFPHGWTFEMCDTVLPDRLRALRFEPISEDASAMFFANTAQYVESPVKIFTGDEQIGTGYSEAVSYANATATTAALAGLPPDVVPTLGPIPPSADLKLLSEVFVVANKEALDRTMACASLPPAPRDCSCP
ncbi:MAG: hypothetical protein DMF56_22135 [Acidobacteria bacterium]|nr:MAG: hypothetical protein DMF56_22135 [Acidobacteriota bacterium]